MESKIEKEKWCYPAVSYSCSSNQTWDDYLHSIENKLYILHTPGDEVQFKILKNKKLISQEEMEAITFIQDKAELRKALLAKLKELGIEDNTIVIFMSDNGPRTKRTKNDLYPDRFVMNLRGTKTSVYENGIRVPFFIKWPGKIPKGVKYTNLAAHIDVMPTLLEACNVPIPKSLELDGISLLPLLTNKLKSIPEREIFIQGHAGSEPFKYFHFTVRGQRYKLISPNDDPYGNIIRPGIAEADMKKLLASLELYDIEKDPSEIENIAKQHPDIVKNMLSRYQNWFDQAMKDRGSDWPQRIYIGTKFQPIVQLSRFDWGGQGLIGEQSRRMGYWEVFSSPGKYNVILRYQKATKSGFAYLRFRGIEKKIDTQFTRDITKEVSKIKDKVQDNIDDITGPIKRNL